MTNAERISFIYDFQPEKCNLKAVAGTPDPVSPFLASVVGR